MSPCARRPRGARDDNAARLDLIDAGVGRIQRARRGIEADLAVEHGAEVALQEVAHAASDPGRVLAANPIRGWSMSGPIVFRLRAFALRLSPGPWCRRP